MALSSGRHRRHHRAVGTIDLPGSYLRLSVGGLDVGWIDPALLPDAAARPPGRLALGDLDALAALIADLQARGACPQLGEPFDLRADRDGRVLGQVDRGALPALGLQAHNAHLNGLVRTPALHVWVGRRAAHKRYGPGRLDHIAAGGIPAGLTPWQTLIKEAGEEAAIPPALAARAVPVGRISYSARRPEGLRRETIHCFDLELPADFTPVPADGEVEDFVLWPIARVAETLAQTDAFMEDVALVLTDLLERQQLPF